MFHSLRRTAAILAVSAASLSAQSYSATTTGAPTFNRQLSSCTALSTVGTAARYHVQPFFVTTAGTFTLSGLSTGRVWDTYVFLYRDNFNPASSATNCVAGNDDGPGGIGTHTFSFSALLSTQYFLVTTGFNNDSDFGEFTNTFTGPASVSFGTLPGTVVPEPSTYALLITGLVGLGGVARRRRAARR